MHGAIKVLQYLIKSIAALYTISVDGCQALVCMYHVKYTKEAETLVTCLEYMNISFKVIAFYLAP